MQIWCDMVPVYRESERSTKELAGLRFCQQELLHRAQSATDDSWYWESKTRIVRFLIRQVEANLHLDEQDAVPSLTSDEQRNLLNTHPLLQRQRTWTPQPLLARNWYESIQSKVSAYVRAARSIHTSPLDVEDPTSVVPVDKSD